MAALFAALLLATVPHAPAKVTPAWNGKTVWMKPGQSFLLALGGPPPTWEAKVTRPGVLSRQVNITVVKGAQGVYRAHAVGRAVVTAVDHWPCQDATPPCLLPNRLFKLVVVVRR
jgi:hypothetical protein